GRGDVPTSGLAADPSHHLRIADVLHDRAGIPRLGQSKHQPLGLDAHRHSEQGPRTWPFVNAGVGASPELTRSPAGLRATLARWLSSCPGELGGAGRYGTTRTSPSPESDPLLARPPTTSVPSAWVTTHPAPSAVPKKSTVSWPPLPKVVSGLPSAW